MAIEWITITEASRMLGISTTSFRSRFCGDEMRDGIQTLCIANKVRCTWRVSLVTVKLYLRRSMRS